jgi:hypothetical protein
MFAHAGEGLRAVAVEVDGPFIKIQAQLGAVGLKIIAFNLALHIPVALPLIERELLDPILGQNLLRPVYDILGDCKICEFLKKALYNLLVSSIHNNDSLSLLTGI